MNPTSSSSSGISSEQPAAQLSLPAPPPLPYSSTLQQQQQQQILALQWLEQQQLEQQNTLKQAMLVAAAAQQQEQQNILQRPSIGNTITSPVSSSTSDLRNHQAIEVELRSQILMQQQRLAQTRESLSIDHAKTLLQERLGQLLTAPTGNQERSSAVSATSNGNNSGTANLDRMLEAETLIQRNRLQETIRMLQIKSLLNEDNSVSHAVNNNAFATSALLLSGGPITPHTIGQSALPNSTTGMAQLLQPGILNMEQVVPRVPRLNNLIDDLFKTTTKSSKRKSYTSYSTSTKEPLQKKLKSADSARTEKLSTFPLPSIKRARGFTVTLKSFQDVWDELEATPLQQDIFIRRLYKYDCNLVD